MSATNYNSLIEDILKETLGLLPDDFTSQTCTTATNNSVFRIDLAATLRRTKLVSSSPHTTSVPAGTNRLIIRVSTPDINLHYPVRLKNEVAFLCLGREALSSLESPLVPRVFAWSDNGEPWILEEWKDGKTLSPDEFTALSEEKLNPILRDIAQAVKLFQDFSLPEGISYGGLTFDDSGTFSSTASVIPCGGPFPTYVAFLKAMCEWQLAACDRNPHLNGWRDYHGNLRERINAFYERGLDDLLGKYVEDCPTIIHGDFNLQNLLFDPLTLRLSAILDFDFAHVGSPVSEFLFSFGEWHGLLTGSAESLEYPATHMMLTGIFPETLDAQERLAKRWDDTLAEIGAKKPSTIGNASCVADVWWFSQELCYFFWSIPRIITQLSDESKAKRKEGHAVNLDRYLTQWGY